MTDLMARGGRLRNLAPFARPVGRAGQRATETSARNSPSTAAAKAG